MLEELCWFFQYASVETVRPCPVPPGWHSRLRTDWCVRACVRACVQGEIVQPPPAMRRTGCIVFVLRGEVEMHVGGRLSHTIHAGHFYGEEHLHAPSGMGGAADSYGGKGSGGLGRFRALTMKHTNVGACASEHSPPI
eukprot:COSAG05_NODE_379_length_10567_cov_18.553687_21_plen_138_part_00